MIKRVLLGVAGPYQSLTLVQRAIEVAGLHGAEITALVNSGARRTLVAEAVPLGANLYAQQLRRYRALEIEEAIARFGKELELACKLAGIKYRLEAESGDWLTTLASHATHHDVLLLDSNNGGDVFERGGVRQYSKLLSRGVRPIVAVGSSRRSIERVLWKYTRSADAAEALKCFIQYRLWPQAKLRLVAARSGERPYLERACEFVRAHGLQVEGFLEPMDMSLSQYASLWDADLIVTGFGAKRRSVERLFPWSSWDIFGSSQHTLFVA